VAFPSAELPPGARKVVTVKRREVLVLNVDGELHALFNRCPHRQAPFETGQIRNARKRTRVGEMEFDRERKVLLCPWHRYEFELYSGECRIEPEKFRVARYRVEEEGEEIAVYV
jgi:3-phenylpropionate/trans-cinnamate dioxygenase ferredoxin subunit